MILESKLNYMSLEELEMLPSRRIEIISEGLLTITKYTLNDIAARMARHDLIELKDDSKVIGVYYSNYHERWKATRKINGKEIFIKTSKQKKETEAAAIDFAKKNNLQIYR